MENRVQDPSTSRTSRAESPAAALIPREGLTYSIETIKKAAYRFSDVLTIDIIPRPDEIECILNSFPGSKEEEQVERIVAAFKNEVLDQDLRVDYLKRDRGNPQRHLGIRAFQDWASRR